jgi:hypothetical protein
LFNKAELFYSRRIGNSPSGAAETLDKFGNDSNYSIQKNPGITLLYNASKFSGRTKNNLGIGIFNAVTQPMYAVVKNLQTGKDSSFLTEPLANYNIIVLDQAFKNRSSLCFTNTNVLRRNNNRNANVSALDLSFFDKKNMYNLKVSPRFSSIWGNKESYTGFANYASFEKISGKFQFSVGGTIESDRYDPNDLGFLLNNNEVSYYGSLRYNYFNPTKHFITHSYRLSINNEHLYQPFVWTSTSVEASANFLFKNFWDISLYTESKPFWRNDYFEARTTGRVFKGIPYIFSGLGGSTDSRKKLFFRYFLGYGKSPIKYSNYQYYEGELRYRFSPKFTASFQSDYELDNGNRGYGFVPSTNNDIIMTTRNIKRTTNIFSAQYGFTPRMNMTIRLRHYWSYVNNKKFHTLRQDGFLDDAPFLDGYNQNFSTFNMDMFYTWDFLWGSRLTFTWKNALGGITELDPYLFNTFRKNFNQVLQNPHSNEISLKMVYFLDYLKLFPTRKKRD